MLGNAAHTDTEGLAPAEVDQLVSYLLQIDLPDTTIDTGPSLISNNTTASFRFTSSWANSTFECRLDGESFSACTSPKSYSGLGDGPHTFLVRAIDPTGTADANPAGFTWTVDATPPESSITDAPPGAGDTGTARFSFTSSEAGGAFECQLDDEGFVECSSPHSYTGLLNGSHIFQVRAIDATGNSDPTPASYTWEVDAPPDTNITDRPPKSSDSADASFSFISSPAGSTFECQLDGGEFVECSSPHSYSGLEDGHHTFQVRAIDATDETDPTPASFTWTVRTAPDDTSVTGST